MVRDRKISAGAERERDQESLELTGQEGVAEKEETDR